MRISSRPEQIREFVKNRSQIPVEELAKHAGKYVAWSPDGTRIIASALEEEALVELVRAAEADPAECAVGWIPDG